MVAEESIHDFQKEIRKDDFMGSKNLSYVDSLLAGYLFDSFNRKQSACSFVYFSQNPSTILYTLHLDKNWLFSRGVSIVHWLRHTGISDDVKRRPREQRRPR